MLGPPCASNQCLASSVKTELIVPVVMKGSAPDSQIEDFHHNIRNCHVGGDDLDSDALLYKSREAEVHDKEACFRSPDHQHLAVFNDKDEFAPESPFVDVFLRHVFDVVSGRKKVGRGALDNVDGGDQDRKEA